MDSQAGKREVGGKGGAGGPPKRPRERVRLRFQPSGGPERGTPLREGEGRQAFSLGGYLRRSGGWLLSVLVHAGALALMFLFTLHFKLGAGGASQVGEGVREGEWDAYSATLRLEKPRFQAPGKSAVIGSEEGPALASADPSKEGIRRLPAGSDSAEEHEAGPSLSLQKASEPLPDFMRGRENPGLGGVPLAPGSPTHPSSEGEMREFFFGIPLRKSPALHGALAKLRDPRRPAPLARREPGLGAAQARFDLLYRGVPRRAARAYPLGFYISSGAPGSFYGQSRSLGTVYPGHGTPIFPSLASRGGLPWASTAGFAGGRREGPRLFPVQALGHGAFHLPSARGDVPIAQGLLSPAWGMGSGAALSSLDGGAVRGPQGHLGSASINGSQVLIRHRR